MSPEPLCRACGSQPLKPFTKSCFLGVDDRSILECPECGLSMLFPQPTTAELEEYYGGSYFGWDLAKEDGKSFFFSRCELGGRPKGRFLDVGCATGIFLAGIKKYSGWDVYGCEFSPQAVKFGREHYGLDIRQGGLEQARFDGDCFDFIHMNNVLEHVLDPLAVLREAARVLKPGGELRVVIPNGRVDRQRYADFSRYIKGTVGSSQDGHLFFFSPPSLNHLFGKSGLTLKRAYSAGLVRGLRAVGILPRTPKWFMGFVPRQRRRVEIAVEDTVHQGKSRPKIYYLYRHGRERALRIPGFLRYGFDYHLVLTKP